METAERLVVAGGRGGSGMNGYSSDGIFRAAKLFGRRV